MADLTNLLEKMNESNTLDRVRDKTKKVVDKRQEKNELSQLDALESLEASFPKAFAEKAEVLVGEKKLFEHSDLLFGIRRSLDGVTRNLRTKFNDFFTNRFGLFPNRAARKRQEAANLAQNLIQADTRAIARGIGVGNERAKVLHDFEKGKWGGLKGVVMGIGSLAGKVAGFGAGDKKIGGGAAGAEKNKEAIQHRDKMGRFAKRTAEGVEELNKTFLESLKEKAKMGLGVILALIAAPFIAIVAFFKSIAEQIRWMKAFTGDKLGKLFAPLKKLFAWLAKTGIGKRLTKLFAPLKNFLSGKGPIGKAFTSLSKTLKTISSTIKGSKAFKAIGTVGKIVKGVITSLGKFFTPIGKFFKAVFGMGKGLIGMSKTATTIANFAKGFGRILGKIFLPITILMSAWDLITGALSGWEKEGEETDATMVTKFIAAIGGGLGKFAENLIGIPLKWLTKGIAWIAGMLGFDEASTEISEFANKIPDFISDIVQAPYNLLIKGIKWITDFFGLTPEKELEGKMMEDYHVASPVDIIISSISKFIGGIVDWFKGLFDIDFSSVLSSLIPAPIKKGLEKIGLGFLVGGSDEKKPKTLAVLQKELKDKEGEWFKSDADREQMATLRKEIETLKREVQVSAAGGGVNVNAPTNIKNETSTHSSPVLTKANPMIVAVASVGGFGME